MRVIGYGKHCAWIAVVAVAAAVMPTGAFALEDDLYEPPPLALPCALTSDVVKSTLRESLLRRGWMAADSGGQDLQASLSRKIVVPKVAMVKANVAVTWDDRQVLLRYVGSEGMQYRKDGKFTTINTSYNKWLRNLEHDFGINLRKACG